MKPAHPQEVPTSPREFQVGDPAWDVALLYPAQGSWSEDDYLGLGTSRLVEFSDGCLEVLPMPSVYHQLIVSFLHRLLEDFVRQHAHGMVLFAPLPVRLRAGKYREPDIVYLRPNRIRDVHGQPDGADLVVEVVSEGPENRRRDLEVKVREYAKAKIAEYWIVDPEQKEIRVLALDRDAYQVRGVYGVDDVAASVLLAGFSVAVADVLAVE